MNNRPYEPHPLLKNLYDVFDLYEIDPYRCEIFEDSLLEIAGIDLKMTYTTRYYVDDHNILVLTIPLLVNVANQFIAFYQKNCPASRVHDVTSRSQSNFRTIQFDAEALIAYVFPFIETKLAKDPTLTQSYKRYEYDDLINQVDSFFAKFHIETYRTDCFEDTIAEMSRYYLSFVPKTNRFFNNNTGVIPDLSNMIFAYLDLDKNFKCEDDIPLIQPKLCRFQPSQNPYHTSLLLDIEKSEATVIINYFNAIKPNCAYLGSEKIEKSTVEKGGKLFAFNGPSSKSLLEIVIDNVVFFHPHFVYHINSTLDSFSLERIERYQQQSEEIVLSTMQCIESLNKLALELLLSNLISKRLKPDAQTLAQSARDLRDVLRNAYASKWHKDKIDYAYANNNYKAWETASNKLTDILKKDNKLKQKKLLNEIISIGSALQQLFRINVPPIEISQSLRV